MESMIVILCFSYRAVQINWMNIQYQEAGCLRRNEGRGAQPAAHLQAMTVDLNFPY